MHFRAALALAPAAANAARGLEASLDLRGVKHTDLRGSSSARSSARRGGDGGHGGGGGTEESRAAEAEGRSRRRGRRKLRSK